MVVRQKEVAVDDFEALYYMFEEKISTLQGVLVDEAGHLHLGRRVVRGTTTEIPVVLAALTFGVDLIIP